MADLTYQRESSRLKEYELNALKFEEEQSTELAYRDMNTRMLDLEKSYHEKQKTGKWAEAENAHKTRKTQIEQEWHRRTATSKAELAKNANTQYSDKQTEYYNNFTLEQMEVFIKNSDRGGNSSEYNDVATDLELYNVMSQKGDEYEIVNLIYRLKESSSKYLATRKSPKTPKGKRRKAMIQRVFNLADELLRNVHDSISQNVTTSYEKFTNIETLQTQEEKNAAVEAACKAHFNLIFQDLAGNKVLTAEERQIADAHMKEILEKVMKLPTASNQSKNLSTKFFNSIGWADHKPRLVASFTDEIKKSPLNGIKLYHSMKTFGDLKDCTDLADQLKGIKEGESRQYYSAGNFGKGTYTAARSRSLDNASPEKKESVNKSASKHSWTFGDNEGSMQLTMMFNENARIISYDDARYLVRELETKYPQFSEYLRAKELREGYNAAEHYAITAVIAFFGYNTLKYQNGCGTEIDYYITTDRKAFSINTETGQGIRQDGEVKIYSDLGIQDFDEEITRENYEG